MGLTPYDRQIPSTPADQESLRSRGISGWPVEPSLTQVSPQVRGRSRGKVIIEARRMRHQLDGQATDWVSFK
jgi:hypothetical protein